MSDEARVTLACRVDVLLKISPYLIGDEAVVVDGALHVNGRLHDDLVWGLKTLANVRLLGPMTWTVESSAEPCVTLGDLI